MTITVVTPAASTALTTLSNILYELGLTSDSGSQDAYLTRMIDVMSEQVQSYLNRPLPQQRIRETVSAKALNTLLVSRYPVTTIHSISYDGTVIDAATYYLANPSTGIIRFWDNALTNHTGYDELYTIEYTYGYTLPPTSGYTLPRAIEQATITAVAYAYHQKGTNPLLKRQELDNVYTREFFSPASANGGLVSGLPATVYTLLQPYRKINV